MVSCRIIVTVNEIPGKNFEALGANAIVGVRYSPAEVMQGASEVVAYGTAVKLQD
ncbi:MAG: YbjQ family protein [Lachnospiraceae bacterium]|nr:YbjQ family protein [Lachnospiraceae bacterium]